MVDLMNFSVFSENRSTLKEVSADRRDESTEIFMTESEKEVINFDKVKDSYVRPLGLNSIPCSVDALFCDQTGTLIFAEFKNGVMDSKKQYSVLKKAYDSVLIFNDITSSQVSDLRNSAEFILIYNESENAESRDPELKEKVSTGIQPSPAYDTIAKTISGFANTEYICFGLRPLQKYCFRKVHTYTEREFVEYLTSH